MFLQLKVVVWKNLIIRKRHWILTIFESTLPILLYLLISYVRSEIGLNKVEVTHAQYHAPVPISYDRLGVHDTYLYYSPNNDFYQDIIKRTQIKFQMYNNNILGFDSHKALLNYYATHHNDTVYAVIFNGNDEKKLDYTIRYHDSSIGNFDTSQMYQNKFLFYPGTGTPYLYYGMLAFQKALDMSFLEKMSGADLDQDNVTIFVQEFPYPPHKDDSGVNTLLMTILPLITLFSFIFLCPAVLKRVVEEKHSGIKELMKMVGMQSWMLWLGWFIYGMIPMLFSIICIVVLLKVPFFGTEYPIIEHTGGSILFVFLLLYCMAVIVFCFAISSFFSRPNIAMLTGLLIWIISYFIPKYSLGLDEFSGAAKLSWVSSVLLNLIPNMALHYGFTIIASYEQREVGSQWYNICKPSSGSTDDITMANVFLMLFFDIVFYMSFTLYMDGINPGKYGVRKSFLFPFHSLIKLVRGPTTSDLQHHPEAACLDFIEKGHGMNIGIEIKHLTKRFGAKLAVNDLNLDIYQKQITVLLGHNGAGKTTTMSMITGMINKTAGVIKMNGKNIDRNMDEIRQTLGLCPQHNLLFTDLTVGEHLQFFAMLKGRTADVAEIEIDNLLEKLNLSDKKNSMASTLSGGMKRKLCLGMAIIGGSSILILDEPTSGMDPESRRALWDLLLAWRSEKTILITTHFMEEADALGDWIAIMTNGTLWCHGTPMSLKKRYGTGYHLSLMVNGSATKEEQDHIKTTIAKVVRDAQFKDSNGNNMVFILPFEDSTKIGDLLSFLEERKDDLKIENISVSVTTLEDVFLKAKLESDPQPEKETNLLDRDVLALLDSNVAETSDTGELPLLKKEGLRIKALFEKKMQFVWKKKFTYLISVLIGLIFFILTVYLSGNVSSSHTDNGPEIKFQLGVYKKTVAFYNGSQDGLIGKMKNFYKQGVENGKSKAVDVENVQQEIINKGIENILYYQEHMIVSAEFQSTPTIEATALYNPMALHSSPISLNLITNALAKAYLGEDYSIATSFWPLESIDSETNAEFSEIKVGLMWLIMVPFGCLFIISSFILFPHIEQSTKFTQLQYMCGVKHYLYWTVNFFADLLLYLVITTILAVLTYTFTPFFHAKEFWALFVLLLMSGLIGIPFAYLFTRKLSASGAFALFIILNIFLGIILSVIVQALLETHDDGYVSTGKKLEYLFMVIFPPFAFTFSAVEFSRKAVTNYNMEFRSESMINSCSYRPDPCCEGNTPECDAYKSYWVHLKYNLLLMLVSCVLYLIINIALDSYLLQKCWSALRYRWYRLRYSSSKQLKPEDDTPNDNRYNTLNAKNLQKTYSGKQIVKNIGFTLNNGQCLGILGVNGAGKTTTFRMLTREEVVDEGNINIKDADGDIDVTDAKYFEKLGYCPQADALNFVLTGRQILSLIAQLRGVNKAQEEVSLFLKMFELEQYADIPCGNYSGGNKRKLSLAIALIGFPKYVLLDEPTNGVDPSSRRKFWNLIKMVQKKKNLSFVLTSHSMVECEALCNDLKIMKNGRFEKEGTISDLKKEFGGFNIKLKLRYNSPKLSELESYDEPDCGPLIQKDEIPVFVSVETLKDHFKKMYGGEVKDEHSGLVHFYVKGKNETWSKMFKDVEKIKSKNNHLIEDYAISEASLEDIFLSVARSEDSDVVDKPSRKKKKKQNNTI